MLEERAQPRDAGVAPSCWAVHPPVPVAPALQQPHVACPDYPAGLCHTHLHFPATHSAMCLHWLHPGKRKVNLPHPSNPLPLAVCEITRHLQSQRGNYPSILAKALHASRAETPTATALRTEEMILCMNPNTLLFFLKLLLVRENRFSALGN